jgi:hypothetical protein
MENVVFEQPNTDTNKFFVGVTEDWSACFRTLVKYTYIDSRYPLFGVTTGVTNPGPDATLPGIDAYNSALPTHVDRVELGTTWHPVDNLVVNGTLYVEQSTHHSELARFNQNGYPWMVSAWYAPTNKLSLTAGYAELTSWIDQDITLGSQARYGAAGGPHVGEWEVGPSFVAPWRYTGKSEVLNLGAAYAFTERLTLSGGLEYVHGFNGVSTPPSPLDQRPNLTTFTPSPYTEISAASRVNINTYRLSAGVDYWLRDGITVFGRYNFYEYDDITAAYNSGTAHMFLGGVTAAY